MLKQSAIGLEEIPRCNRERENHANRVTTGRAALGSGIHQKTKEAAISILI